MIFFLKVKYETLNTELLNCPAKYETWQIAQNRDFPLITCINNVRLKIASNNRSEDSSTLKYDTY